MRLRGVYEVHTDEERLQLLADLVEEGSQDPVIRETAIRILKAYRVPEKDEIGEVKAIFDWVKRNIRYTKDITGRDSYHTAKRILELKAGDCIPLTQRLVVRNKKTGMYEVVEAGDLKDCYNKYEALSYNFLEQKWEFKDILNWVYKKRKKVIGFKLYNNTEFEITSDHNLYILKPSKKYLLLKLKTFNRLKKHNLLNKIFTFGLLNIKEKISGGLKIIKTKFKGIKEVCDITVKDNHNFVLDNGMLVKNCDDFTILLDSLLASIGYPVGARIITASPDKGFHHIYSLVKVKGRWIPLDPTNKRFKIGQEPRYYKKKDFQFILGE